MSTEKGSTAVMEKDGKGSTHSDRRIAMQGVPSLIKDMRENETVYAVVTPVRHNG
jgi:hypothetical protein